MRKMSNEPKNCKPAFNGEILEIPNISVDNFIEKNKKAYFLSHTHSDHTVGMLKKIEGERLRENGAKIYMSEATKTIMSTKHQYLNTKLYEIVEPLKTEMTYFIELPDDQSFEVTLIPVTHMIGAVMFLFKTNEKTVLFTGDFLVEEDKIIEITKLHDKNGEPLKIDTLYIDQTFDNIDYEHFPSRSLCHREVVDEIRNWLAEPDREVTIVQNYFFSYDDVYKKINKELKIKLFTRIPEMTKNYRYLYGEDNFLTNDENSKIHIIDNVKEYKKNAKNLLITMSAKRGCHYHPERNSAIYKYSANDMFLCYPTHCSKSQCKAFIRYFSPLKTVKFSEPVSSPKSWTPFKSDRNRRIPQRGRLDRIKKQLDFERH